MEPSPKKKAKRSSDAAAAAAENDNDPEIPPPAAAAPSRSAADDEALLLRRRAMNTIHSRRKRERQRIEIEVLKEQCAEFKAKNRQLQEENAQFELWLRALQQQQPMPSSLHQPSTIFSPQQVQIPNFTAPSFLAEDEKPKSSSSSVLPTGVAQIPPPPPVAWPYGALPPLSYIASPHSNALATGDLGRRAPALFGGWPGAAAWPTHAAVLPPFSVPTTTPAQQRLTPSQQAQMQFLQQLLLSVQQQQAAAEESPAAAPPPPPPS